MRLIWFCMSFIAWSAKKAGKISALAYILSFFITTGDVANVHFIYTP
jgi:hypothetical protein